MTHQTALLPVADAPAVALVVIPTLDEARNIARVIGELLQCEAEIRIVVADGGSTDGTPGIAEGIGWRDPRVSCLHNPRRIQSAAVNLALYRHGGGARWLIRADAHASYPACYVDALIAEAERTGADSVVVAMETRASGCFARGVAAAQNSPLGNGGAAHRSRARAGWVDHGHHALFRAEVFEAIGGYDEDFPTNEDAELDTRLRAAGARIWLTDRTHLVYEPRDTLRGLWRQYLRYGRGRAATMLKHRQRPKLRQALPLAVPPALLLAAAAPLGGALLALPAALWAAASCGYGAVLAARARSACVLWAGPAAMTMHLAWTVGFLGRIARGRS